MARKDLLKSLMTGDVAPAPSDAPARVDAAKPRYSTGAIGAVSQSIAGLKSRAVQEIDPRMVDGAGLKDRLSVDPKDHADLVASIREYGQQVPILVRINPNNQERYEIVYGRRRLAALKELGLPIKAMVRDLNDRDLAVVQGQENSARKDLSYIEKANFARQMRDAKYDRKVICDALNTDKTLISRMLSVADRIPLKVIEKIGAAPKIGRDRWIALADMIEAQQLGSDQLLALIPAEDASDDRFDGLMRNLMPKKSAPKAPEQTEFRAADGAIFAKAVQKGSTWTLSLDQAKDDGFSDWLSQNLAQLHSRWKTGGI